jgi:hypothetical protein
MSVVAPDIYSDYEPAKNVLKISPQADERLVCDETYTACCFLRRFV